MALGKDETQSTKSVLVDCHRTGALNREHDVPAGSWVLGGSCRGVAGLYGGCARVEGVGRCLSKTCWDSSQDGLKLTHSHKVFHGWQISWKNAALFVPSSGLCTGYGCASCYREIKSGNKKTIGCWQDQSIAKKWGQYMGIIIFLNVLKFRWIFVPSKQLDF